MDKKTLLNCLLQSLLVGLLLVVLTLVFRSYLEAKLTESAGMGVGLTVDPSSGTFVEPVKEVTKEDTDTGGIAIPGWGSIIISANQTEVNVNLKNPEDNKDKYDLSFEITLEGEETPIAKTGLIPPGESARKLQLARALEPGEYKATVLVQPYRINSNIQTNNAIIETVMIAE